MKNEGYLELALERFARTVAAKGSKEAQVATATALSQVVADVESGVDEHAAQRQFVHGVGPLYVAKTSSPSQFVKWTEIEGRPDLSMMTFEIDADKIVSGTVAHERLPIAELGEVSENLVRANDPRLSGGLTFIRKTSESLAAGDWVNIHVTGGEHRVRRAVATHPDGALGFVAQSYGVNEDATIFLAGENAWVQLPSVTSSDIGRTVFLGSTPGRCGFAPPGTEGTVIQPVGTVIRAASPVATVLVRFELRFHL